MDSLSLDASYQRCRELHRAHGRTYFLATRLLPAWKRRHVHALYGFTRYTDDIVDAEAGFTARDMEVRARRLDAWASLFRQALAGGSSHGDAILPALLHTIATFHLDAGDFEAFLRSMRMDLSTTGYATYDELLDYMDGSAAVIGTMMLPILLATGNTPSPTSSPALAAAHEPARQLGLAFQLTNFIRDVGEDLRRGRVYLPQSDLDRFGVAQPDLAAPAAGPALRRLIAFEVDRARGHYRAAQEGLALLPSRSRRCIHLAMVVYGKILDQVEQADYDVLSRRATVPNRGRAAAVLRELSGSR